LDYYLGFEGDEADTVSSISVGTDGVTSQTIILNGVDIGDNSDDATIINEQFSGE